MQFTATFVQDRLWLFDSGTTQLSYVFPIIDIFSLPDT